MVQDQRLAAEPMHEDKKSAFGQLRRLAITEPQRLAACTACDVKSTIPAPVAQPVACDLALRAWLLTRR